MDMFAAIIFATIAAGLLWVISVAWLSRNRPIDELIDKQRNQRWAARMSVEEHDLPAMIAAANDYRRKRGVPEVTLEQLTAQINDELRAQIASEASKQLKAQLTRGNQTKERRGF